MNTPLTPRLLGYFRKCPAFYARIMNGEVEEKDTKSVLIGKAAHTRILKGARAFAEEFLVSDGPINPKTNQPYGRNTKAYQEWAEAQTKPIVGIEDAAYFERLAAAIQAHLEAADLLSFGAARRVQTATVEKRDCEVVLDFVSEGNELVELKTTADLEWFEHDIKKFGYLVELAMKRLVHREATSENASCYFVVVEKAEPFRVGVWRVAEHVLDEAEGLVRAAIRRLKDCERDDTFPTHYESIRTISAFR